jgi:hypothetical protein
VSIATSCVDRHVKLVAAASLLLACLISTPAIAVSTQQLCATAKLRAAGAELGARLFCETRGLVAGTDPACIARASRRRDEAFRRAESRGGCANIGDSEDVGFYVVLRVLDAEGATAGAPAASRCAQLELLTASRSALQLSALYAHAGRVRDAPFVVAAVERAAVSATAAYQRAQSNGDCPHSLPADEINEIVVGAVGSVRDRICPTCGAVCPCWTVARLDASFPPRSFASMGGTSCALIALDDMEAITSGKSCIVYADGGRYMDLFPRAGFGLFFGNYCSLADRDLDPDADGICSGAPQSHELTPGELSVCFDDMKASLIYRAECHVPK